MLQRKSDGEGDGHKESCNVENKENRNTALRLGDDRVSSGKRFYRKFACFKVGGYQVQNLGVVFNQKNGGAS